MSIAAPPQILPSRGLSRTIIALAIVGLVLRVGGLFFSGMSDIYQMLLEWGAAVRNDGLGKAFAINYGPFSYALFGVATAVGEEVPRFWWLPYKLIILGFDVGVLALLLRLVPPAQRVLVFALYWANPWFILHEAYHGFWEAPHIAFGLMAVLASGLGRDRRRAWMAVGALLAVSALFKPQGLLHFVVPLGGYLVVQALVRGRRGPLAWYAAGGGLIAALVSLWLWASGGSAFGLIDNYRSVAATMSSVSNGGPGIWQVVVFTYMRLTGQEGHVAFVRMPRVWIGMFSAIAAVTCLVILGRFALKYALAGQARDNPPGSSPSGTTWWERVTAPATTLGAQKVVLLVLALGALVVAQFGARAHVNHSYTAMVLLVPLAAMSVPLRRRWLAMAAVLAAVHLMTFRFGPPVLLPQAEILDRYSAAQTLVNAIVALPAYQNPDVILRAQAAANAWLDWLPGAWGLAALSVAAFVIACGLVNGLFRRAACG
jgi:hypothetical protein